MHLSNLYANYIPNTSKYLTHALKGIQLDIAANDSITRSFIYLNLSNAFIQNGFIEEANEYIDKSLDYNSDNYFAPYVKAFIQYAIDKDIEQTKTALKAELKKDSTRIDILQEVAKLYYFQEKYDTAYLYYEKFVEARIVYNFMKKWHLMKKLLTFLLHIRPIAKRMNLSINQSVLLRCMHMKAKWMRP